MRPLVLYGQALRRATRAPYPLLAITVAPLAVLWLLCQLFGALPDHTDTFPTAGYLAFVAPALAVASGLPFAIWCGMAVGRDAHSRFLDQFLTAPLPRSALAAGAVGAAATGAVWSALLILATSRLSGSEMGSAWSIPAIAALAGVLGALYAALSWVITTLAPSRRSTIMIIAAILAGTFVLCNLLLPNGLLPVWLRDVAPINPLTAAIDGARGVAGAQPDWHRWGRDLVVLCALALAARIGAAALPRPLREEW